MTHKVFVYGTLLRGCANNRHYLRDSKLLCVVRTTQTYRMVDLGAFPAIIQDHALFSSEMTTVSGEVYEVTPEVLRMLDRLEGHPGFYHRTVTEIDGYGKVYIYVLTNAASVLQSGAQPIIRGDWKQYLIDKRKAV